MPLKRRGKISAWLYRQWDSNDFHIATQYPWWVSEQQHKNNGFEPVEIEIPIKCGKPKPRRREKPQ